MYVYYLYDNFIIKYFIGIFIFTTIKLNIKIKIIMSDNSSPPIPFISPPSSPSPREVLTQPDNYIPPGLTSPLTQQTQYGPLAQAVIAQRQQQQQLLRQQQEQQEELLRQYREQMRQQEEEEERRRQREAQIEANVYNAMNPVRLSDEVHGNQLHPENRAIADRDRFFRMSQEAQARNPALLRERGPTSNQPQQRRGGGRYNTKKKSKRNLKRCTRKSNKNRMQRKKSHRRSRYY